MDEMQQVTPARILVVDDEEPNVTLLERVLASRGHAMVESTTDPAEAIRIIEVNQPDLILLDLHMTGTSGFDILERMRSDPATKHVPVLILTGDESRDARERALGLGARDFLTKPFDRREISLRVDNLLETRRLHRQLAEQNSLLEARVRERTAELWKALQAVEQSEREVRRSHGETVVRLAIAAEQRHKAATQHINRMSAYSQLLARAAGLDDATVELIGVASAMHDIGKIGISDSVLLKAGKLTREERVVMQEHARLGHDILSGSSSELLQMAADIALSHHECWDGSGYPAGLAGTQIPMAARVAAIADVYDSITTDRENRKAMPFAQAIAAMRAGRGTRFDPDLLDVFFDNIDQVLRVKDAWEEKG